MWMGVKDRRQKAQSPVGGGRNYKKEGVQMRKRLRETVWSVTIVMVMMFSLVISARAFGADYKVYYLEYAQFNNFPTTLETLETVFPKFVAWPFGFVYIEDSSSNRKILVDCGLDDYAIKTWLDPEVEFMKIEKFGNSVQCLAKLNVKPEEITDIILTHLHWDHAAGIDQFPNATFYVQREELRFAVFSPEYKFLRTHYKKEVVTKFIGYEFDGRVKVLNGDEQIFDGIRAYLTPGHTLGSQVVAVQTKGGVITLVGDAAHSYANLMDEKPDVFVVDTVQMLQSYRKIKAIPGFDKNKAIVYHAIETTKFPVAADHIYRLD
jgi:glyoxylase-like metal-dependent hydrolase (beta-lactamase superfamily II)